MTNKEKVFISKTVLFFDFTSIHQILSKSIHWVKSWNCSIYSVEWINFQLLSDMVLELNKNLCTYDNNIPPKFDWCGTTYSPIAFALKSRVSVVKNFVVRIGAFFYTNVYEYTAAQYHFHSTIEYINWTSAGDFSIYILHICRNN